MDKDTSILYPTTFYKRTSEKVPRNFWMKKGPFKEFAGNGYYNHLEDNIDYHQFMLKDLIEKATKDLEDTNKSQTKKGRDKT